MCMKDTSGAEGLQAHSIDPADGDRNWRGILTGRKKDLRSRKQELVRNAIIDSAIALFEKKGFEHTDVAEIAEAAGISKRSFFRYFATRDDLLARSIVEYGAVLVGAIRSAPRQCTDLEVIHQTLLAGVRYNEQPEARARQLIAISTSHPTARQAYLSRKHLVEDAVAEAFASRARNARRDDLRVRLLAGITLALMNATIGAWFLGEEKTLEAAAKHAEAELEKITTFNTAPLNSKKKGRGKKVALR
jgi:AcrR family transcriptional regulator